MSISVFNLFSIGIGPSSSHTVGPMKAAYAFVLKLAGDHLLSRVERVVVEIFGSLALTGVGHGTDVAILNGLAGALPDQIEPALVRPNADAIKEQQQLYLLQQHHIHFNFERDFIFKRDELLPLHTNGMRFSAFDAEGNLLFQQIYYSIGGGFIVTAEDFGKEVHSSAQPFPFKSARELIEHCREQRRSIAGLMLENERVWRSEAEIRQQLLLIAEVMRQCIERGCSTKGILPGGLNVKRRAAELAEKLSQRGVTTRTERPDALLWPTVYAMAVNEENAAGGRIVTAPTNGAAGIIPAVLNFYRNFHLEVNDDKIIEFLLTAGAIGILYKTGASISGAEVGCQGEVGVACSMAAGAFTAVLGGTLEQIENAAEMAMEHHLGMTCDPMMGLVQVPCIERNGVAAEKAIKLTYLALLEDGKDKKVSLDKVIATMLQTGRDMKTIYKETSLGGLAANIAEC